jgi:fatty-acyl-CoA synthase
MLNGLMMQEPLLLKSIVEFGERHYPDVEIVSVTHDNPLHRYTFTDAFRRVRKLANALEKLGCRPSDRIGTLAWNDYRHFEIYYAVSCSGMVCSPINPRLSLEHLTYIINHAEDQYLLVDPVFMPLVEKVLPDCPSVRGIIVLSDMEHMPETEIDVAHCYESLIADELETFDWPLFDENAACALCYTAGETGEPKGVLYSHRSTILHSYAVALPDAFNLSNRDCVLPAVPMFYVHAWGLPYAVVITGTKMVLPGSKKGDAEVLHSLMSWEGVTLATGAPTVWIRLMEYLKGHDEDLDTLERLVVGGSACPPALIEYFQKQYGVYVHHAWGMTETSPLGLVNTPLKGLDLLPPEEQINVRAKQGRAIFGMDLKITDKENRELPWDGQSSGMLKVRGPWVCRDYYGADENDDQTHDSDGWFITGDIANIDSKGYVQLIARAKDMIRSGGEWISAQYLEKIAASHPTVADVAVIGIEHAEWGERPLMVVVRPPDVTLTADEVLGWFDDNVVKWWKPDAVEFVDTLPHMKNGKLDKQALRDQYKNYRFGDHS